MKIIINKKIKKLMCKVLKCCVRILLCAILIMSQLVPVYAAIDSGYVTKPEFNSVLADFNSRLFSFEEGLNEKIESKVNEYLNKKDINGAKGYIINNETEIAGTKNDTTGAYTNVTAIVGIDVGKLKLGDNIYIKDINSLNYWVSQVSPSISLDVINQKVDLSTLYDKTEVDNLLNDKQNDIMTNISGTANQILRRNATNTGLEFSDDVKVVEISSTPGTLTTDQLNILKASKLNFIKYSNYMYTYQYDSGSTRYYSMNYVYSGKVYWVYISINMSTGAYSLTNAQGLIIGDANTDSLSSAVSYTANTNKTLFSKTLSAGTYLCILTVTFNSSDETKYKRIGIGGSASSNPDSMYFAANTKYKLATVTCTGVFTFTSSTTIYAITKNEDSGSITNASFTYIKLLA